MYQKTNAKFAIKVISVFILTLLFSCSLFFDTAGPPLAYAEERENGDSAQDVNYVDNCIQNLYNCIQKVYGNKLC